jgi:hypothetical protein
MTGKNAEDEEWHTVSLPVRADILDKAAKQGVDINGLCNRALATAVGIDYNQQENDRAAARKPVIVAKEAAAVVIPPAIPLPLPAPGPAGHLHPVINADDPAAVTSVKRAARNPAVRPVAASPAPSPSPGQAIPPAVPAKPSSKPAKAGTGKSAPKKRAGPDLRKFVAETILREDAEDAAVTKEALYQAFARWCRERKIAAAPDRKTLTVALKNQFAFSEKVVDGEPSWVNVRLK